MFTPDELRELPEAISGPRFATYLRVCANDPSAALAEDYARLRERIEWRGPAVAGWVDEIERVTELIAPKP